ncbi:CdaR family transcriptional regulator [Aneurinibacillus migulanus]|uniref:Carbohydrate diacid regulator n=1 Tax=Aneurinibacillus migulanus TaxID=47500 RepID=A0A0D1YIU0_ANEMI|nr:sugar diacid recognition domain-containing protein [Aneurinibacillus migulanus]KIV58687.1 hypothetical protein TS65_04730 [Aneurinibacillus migulanus]KON96376.1 hypothetical protein AF333_13720 [Aneurinibacillus migulanus]MED0892309.1 sugar diacid recognition domain-containing protein [Aneurinibacillus migulanus]MED1615739.1 sugar diacid recognition domain-containing protein [Aneurinibacillus migulanus]MED4731078.1 sugar diacid recognition domain-containing protein [Aneurinibacillus migulan
MVLKHIAQHVAENTTEILGHPISITDDKGYIIGATDRSRLGTFHQASLDVLRQNRMVSYDANQTRHLSNVLPGVASPIIFNNKPIGVLGVVGDPLEVKKYVQLVKSHVEMMYQESFKQELVVLESKTLDMLVQYVLHFDNEDEAEHVMKYGEMLGYRLDIHRVCLLITIDGLKTQLSRQQEEQDAFSLPHAQQELLDYAQRIFYNHAQDIVSPLNLEQILVLKAVEPCITEKELHTCTTDQLERFNQYLKRRHKLDASVAIGDIQQGVEGIAESYRNAVKTLTAGRKLDTPLRIYDYNDWRITLELLSREIPSFIQDKLFSMLDRFLTYDNFDTLAHTFLTYCACGLNMSETARMLFIHRNTLVYRLDKIGELTSLDVTSFEHCLLLYIAVKNRTQLSAP